LTNQIKLQINQKTDYSNLNKPIASALDAKILTFQVVNHKVILILNSQS